MDDATRRKAVFRELGRTVAGGTNPGQACAAALERAFRAGVEAARRKPDFDTSVRKPDRARVIEAIDLAPRCRDAMRRISLWSYGVVFGERTHQRVRPPLLLVLRNSGFPPTPRWHLTDPESRGSIADFGEATLKPLFAMGLLTTLDKPFLACVTHRGKLLCMEGRTYADESDGPTVRILPPAEDEPKAPGFR